MSGDGIESAKRFLECDEATWPALFESMRRNKELSRTIRTWNDMLHDPSQRPLAVAALARIGLWHDRQGA